MINFLTIYNKLGLIFCGIGGGIIAYFAGGLLCTPLGIAAGILAAIILEKKVSLT